MFMTIGKLLAIVLCIMIALPPAAWARGRKKIPTKTESVKSSTPQEVPLIVTTVVSATGYQAPVLKTVKGKIAKEINKLNQFHNSMKIKPPRLLLAAAQGMIIAGGSLETAKNILQQKDRRPPPRKKLPKMSVTKLMLRTRGKDTSFQGSYKEPGILGLPGGYEYLDELFHREADTLFKAEPPKDKQLASLMVSFAGMDTKQKQNDADGYAGIMSTIANRNDALALGFKAMIFNGLRATMEKPEARRTKAEKAFIKGLEGYIKQQYIAVAEQAKKDWEDWLKECERKGREKTGRSLMVLFTSACNEKPYDFNEAVRARLTPGRSSMEIITASLVVTGGVTAAVAASTGAIGALGASSSTGVFGSIASSVAPFLVKTATVSGVGVGAGAAVSAIAAPVAIIASAAMMAVMQGNIVFSQVKAEKRVNKALEDAKKMTVDADKLLANPEGVKQFLFFFGKALGDESPTKPKKCGITLYEDADYKGKSYYVDTSVIQLDAVEGSTTRSHNFNNKTSSIRFTRNDCLELAIIVYDAKKYGTGGRGYETYVNDTAYVGDTMNDQIGSIRLYPDGKVGPENETKGCGLCLFQHPNYGGAFYCTTEERVKNLKDHNFNNKATSVLFDNNKCDKAVAWLFQKKESKGHSLRVTKSYPDLRKARMAGAVTWNNAASSLEFQVTGKPTTLLAGCRVCVYDQENMAGQYFCAWPGKPAPDFIDPASQADLDNKASSVLINQEGCPKGKVLTGTLYADKNYKGKSLNLPFPNGLPGLKKSYYAPAKTWNNKASSLKANLRDPNCSATLYEHTSYRGRAQTLYVSQADLRQWDFNNQVSSLKINNKNCSAKQVTLCDRPNFDKKAGKGCQAFAKSTANIGAKFNDEATSVKFDIPPKPIPKIGTTKVSRCSATLYDAANYKGRAVTLNINQSLPDLRKQKFNNVISSVKIDNESCPFHKVTLCDLPNFSPKRGKGCRTYKTSTKFIGKEFNDEATSAKFTAN